MHWYCVDVNGEIDKNLKNLWTLWTKPEIITYDLQGATSLVEEAIKSYLYRERKSSYLSAGYFCSGFSSP